jgi:transcription elongation factor Elf1
MPNTNRPLPIHCPKCHHNRCTLVVKSRTIMTVQCSNCRHSWATELEALPPDIQRKVHVLLESD